MYYREKVMYSKLRCLKFKRFESSSVFVELQLAKISLNFECSCCDLKIRDLVATQYVGFPLSLFSIS